MLSMNPRSVRFRTTVGAALALAALFVAAGIAVDWLVGRQIQQSFDVTLLEQATDRATLLANGAPVDSVLTVVGHEVVVVASSGDAVGVVGATLADDVAALLALPPGIAEVEITVEEGDGDEGREASELEAMRVAVAVAANNTKVIVGNEGENARSTQAQVRNILIAGVPFVTVAGALVAWFITGRALRPVRQIQNDLDKVVHAGDGRRVAEPSSHDEIADLAETINEVLARLDAQSLSRREFVANASHELKSPLANAKILLDTATDAELAEAGTGRQAIRTELDRLHALVEDLLYLARADEAAPPSPLLFDLDDLVFDEAERVAARTPKRLDASGVQPAKVMADRSEIARAIRNLVENSERFAVERVAVSIAFTNGMVAVVVDDDGPGIPPEGRAVVFERFARLGSDRARSDGGTGLGLAIVDSIAARNGGAVVVDDSPLGGARFELSLPRST